MPEAHRILGRLPRTDSAGKQLRRSSLFLLYARVFRLLLAKSGIPEEDEYSQTLDTLVLPSDNAWRLSVYYSLVQLQREIDAAERDQMSEEQQPGKRPARRAPVCSGKWEWEPDPRMPYPPRPRAARCQADGQPDSAAVVLESSVQPGWRLSDVLLAAKLLGNQPHLHFQDEAQMRRVFGLAYDVLRYEQVLERALDDVGFWVRFRQLHRQDKVVRLLLYDMQGRKFARVGDHAAVAARQAALHQAGLLEIEDALNQLKTRLAASLSRLRIGGSALSLDELLPAHLRTAEGVTWGEEGSLATGWVNGVKATSRENFIQEMGKLGLRLCVECSAMDELDEDQFMFDPLCPKVVNLHERAREKLAASALVKSYAFVFLERSLCLGAAALVHAIRVGKMCGPVILTHPLAPRHTGYLAELLVDIDGIGRLLVFGLGAGLSKHKDYLDKLGIPVKRCKLFAERYDTAATTPELERTTIVLATPPTSCTGVRDVVDLAVARGGDLRLLETLTCSEALMNQQPNNLLTEQMACLSYALSKPNCQLLVYEAHTLLPCETTDMVRQAVDNANKMALDKYLKEHPPRKKSPTLDGAGKKLKGKKSQSLKQLSKTQQNDETETEDKTSHTEIPVIPDSDLFEISDLNDLYKKDCSSLVDPGSFIVVIKRKDMMQFNSLFMIKVAEAKGVFGDPNKQPEPPTKQPVLMSTPSLKTSPSGRKSGKRTKVELERLRAPTFATIMRALQEHTTCPRHARHVSAEENQLESQKSKLVPEPVITPSSCPNVKNSSDDSRLELTRVSKTIKGKRKKLLEGKYNELGPETLQKLEDVEILDTITEQQDSKMETTLENEIHNTYLVKTDFDKFICTLNSDYQTSKSVAKQNCEKYLSKLIESESIGELSEEDDVSWSEVDPETTEPTLDVINKNRKIFREEKISSILPRKPPLDPLEAMKEQMEAKGDGVFFNVSLKQKQLQRRRKILPYSEKKPYRIIFQNRLETVFEQSQNFSYLFPEEE